MQTTFDLFSEPEHSPSEVDRLRMLALSEALTRHNQAYYVHDAPVISDAQYDVLFNELLALERQYPQWRTVGCF